MCFSALASFTASGFLLTAGVVSIGMAKKKDQLSLAAIPVMFAAQQFAEGILWMTLSNDSLLPWKSICTYLFVLFAYVIWPTWVPLSFWLIEKNPLRKKLLKLILGIGVVLSFILGLNILFFDVSAQITDCHINYDIASPWYLKMTGHVFYFVAIIIPPFLSKNRWSVVLGVLNLVAYFVSKLYFHDYVFSVWCFFAAIISVCIIFIIYTLNRHNLESK